MNKSSSVDPMQELIEGIPRDAGVRHLGRRSAALLFAGDSVRWTTCKVSSLSTYTFYCAFRIAVQAPRLWSDADMSADGNYGHE